MKLKAGPPTPTAAQLKRRLGFERGDGNSRRKRIVTRRWLSHLVLLSVLARSAIVVAIVVAAAVLVWREVYDTAVYVEPILVPSSLAEQGLSSDVLTSQVVDRIGDIVRELGSPSDTPETRATTEMPEFRVITFGPSLQAIGREIRRVTGRPDRRIAGAVTRYDAGWHATMRDGATHIATSIAVADATQWQSKLIDAAAIGVLRLTDANLLMQYQYSIYNRTLDPAALGPLEATLEFREQGLRERDSREVRHMRALVSFERGDFDSAESLWLRMVREYPDRMFYKSLAAMAAKAAGRFDTANTLLSEVAQSSASDPRPGWQAHAAGQLIELGRPRDALALCIAALRSNPSPEARLVAAYALNQMHRPTEAIALLEGGSPKDSEGFVRSRHILADAYVAQNDLKRVAEIRTLLSREFPNDYNTRIVVAKDAEIRGDFRDALTAYATLGGDLTTDLGSQIGQARVLIKDGRPIEALPYLERHLQREPWSVEGHWWLAKARAMSGQFGAADAEYAKVMASDPDHVIALKEWAEVLTRLGRQNDAKAKLALAVAAEQRLAVPIDIPVLIKP